MQKRRCIQCRSQYPETPDYFHKAKDGGYHARCKKCRSEYEKTQRKTKRQRKLDEIEKGAVDTYIAAARIGGANVPHSSELLEVLMEYFGGVRGFANAYMKQFYEAAPGGAFRTKMLDTRVRLVQGNTAMGGAKKPLDLWTDDELDDELQKRVMQAAMVINAQDVQRLPLVEADFGAPGGMPPLSAEHPIEARPDAVPSDNPDDEVR
jgi:hypothetical protein